MLKFTKKNEPERIQRILELLDNEYGTEFRCFLNYETPWQLLVATMLSAQCTDARVNIVTKDLHFYTLMYFRCKIRTETSFKDILNGNKKLIKVFVYGDMDSRIKRVSEHHSISEQEARVMIYKTDKKRANYYNYYTSLKWGKSDNYNLMLDTGKIGVEGAAKIICEYVKILEENN